VNDFSKAGANVSIFPNPFRHETTIQVRCEKPSQAYITVYDAAGQKVAILVNDSFNTGVRDFTWEGTSVSGKKLDNGIYFVHIMINGFTKIQKVIINR
jgi:flagellar hook assembly protein FlgD